MLIQRQSLNKKREDTKNLSMGPSKIKSTVLSEAEEEAIVAFRKMMELPLDVVLYSLQETISHLRPKNLKDIIVVF